jgi:hypothetical protein
MKLDPGMHIGLHFVFFGKTDVTKGYTGFNFCEKSFHIDIG